MDPAQKEYLRKQVEAGHPVHVKAVVCKTMAEFEAATKGDIAPVVSEPVVVPAKPDKK